MDLSFTAPLSGVKASQQRLDVAAHDVANVNTPGFQEQSVIQTEMRPEGTQIAAIRRTSNDNPQYSNTDLAEETKEQIVSKDAYSANLTVIKVKDRMMGELLDLVG